MAAILGETREAAYRKQEAVHGEGGDDGLVRDFFKRAALPDLAGLDADQVIDPAVFNYTQDQSRPVGFIRSFAELTAAEALTPRQLVRHVDGGHRLAVGTPRDIADTILDWWRSGAVDGFNIHIPVLPDGIAEFNRTVTPLLQAVGAFPTQYDGSTIRRRLGPREPVPSPAGQG
jgi:alkanesulfonate monooxygenase SsuD/methylene tetrahydromethanopterin reductase-like flavin-dependent oxidoreductase (luciferase family)